MTPRYLITEPGANSWPATNHDNAVMNPRWVHHVLLRTASVAARINETGGVVAELVVGAGRAPFAQMAGRRELAESVQDRV